MSNLSEQTLEDDQPKNQAETWETMARAWLSAFPEAKAVSVTEVESWIDSNLFSLPAELQSMPRSDIIDRLLSIQNYMRSLASSNDNNNNLSHEEPEEKDMSQPDGHPARFQRTEQWRPVYSWLESLKRDEVVKSKDITEWLNQYPDIGGELLSKHSKYHLLHYIKKCHLKILKRREKRKGLNQSNKTAEVNPNGGKTIVKPLALPSFSLIEYKMEIHRKVENEKKNYINYGWSPNPRAFILLGYPLNNLPKDSDLYVAKRNEALRKYEILVALEKKLAPTFST